MRQEVDNLERLAVDYVLDGDLHLRAIQAELAKAEVAHDGAAIACLHTELDKCPGLHRRCPRAQAAGRPGVPTSEQMDRRVGDFSGGWRMRLNLAQALMCPSELLLLDEPTNHLDLDAILWLEDWLKGYPRHLLLISHDRDFLDAVVDHVAHLEQQKLTSTAAATRPSGAPRRAPGAAAAGVRETAGAARAHGKVHRPLPGPRRPRPVRRRAGSRPWSAWKSWPRRMWIRPSTSSSARRTGPSPLLNLSGGASRLWRQDGAGQGQAEPRPGARIGLLGPNGAGKSTLIKTLAGDPRRARWHRARREPGDRLLRPAPARFA